MDEWLITAVRRRAGFVCEYCRMPDNVHPGTFELEHIIAVKHGGKATLSNLAYACLHCNRHKGTDLAGIDRQGPRERLVRLFHPRRHRWHWHFRWDGPILTGRTAIGRVTVHVLSMNNPLRVALRQELIDENAFPPP